MIMSTPTTKRLMGIVCKDNPGQIILEVSDYTDEDTKCFVWQDERWHDFDKLNPAEVEY